MQTSGLNRFGSKPSHCDGARRRVGLLLLDLAWVGGGPDGCMRYLDSSSSSSGGQYGSRGGEEVQIAKKEPTLAGELAGGR